MAIRKKLKGGFTLVELMIVVAIVGVLAVLAVYGVRKYIANAKTAEAKNSLGQIAKDAVTAFEGERMSADVLSDGASTQVLRQICPTGSKVTVGVATDIAGKKYQAKKADWSAAADVGTNTGWPCVRFEMTAPQYYMYSYNGNTNDFSSTANGDLNGDGTLSTFVVSGAIESGRLKQGPSIKETSPEE